MVRIFGKKTEQVFRGSDRRMLRQQLLLSGKIASRQIHALDRLPTLADAEFQVTSQWGEDGIIEWLCHKLPDIPRSFVEFGVENYAEANTRFLLENRGWRGLVIDPSSKNVGRIRLEEIYWRYDITAVAGFITAENINEVIGREGFSGDIGILSIDIDGNDYWVLKHLDIVRPSILIIEANTTFGDLHAITVPYDPSFSRFAAHPSGLYFGASIRALIELAARKGFRFVGTTSAGINAFFVREEIAGPVLRSLGKLMAYPGRIRDSRDAHGMLTYLAGEQRAMPIRDLPVHELTSDTRMPLHELFPLYGDSWFGDKPSLR